MFHNYNLLLKNFKKNKNGPNAINKNGSKNTFRNKFKGAWKKFKGAKGKGAGKAGKTKDKVLKPWAKAKQNPQGNPKGQMKGKNKTKDKKGKPATANQGKGGGEGLKGGGKSAKKGVQQSPSKGAKNKYKA